MVHFHGRGREFESSRPRQGRKSLRASVEPPPPWPRHPSGSAHPRLSLPVGREVCIPQERSLASASEAAELTLARAFSGALSRQVGYGNWLFHLFARYVLASWSSGRSPSAWSQMASSRA